MSEVDQAATEPVEVLIGRAGSAGAWAARRLLGGCYGRRVAGGAAGRVEVADIGRGPLVARVAQGWQIGDSDVASLLPRRPPQAHKWQTAVAVIAGSPGMTGAPWLVARGALRAGAGYVRLGIPRRDFPHLPPP